MTNRELPSLTIRRLPGYPPLSFPNIIDKEIADVLEYRISCFVLFCLNGLRVLVDDKIRYEGSGEGDERNQVDFLLLIISSSSSSSSFRCMYVCMYVLYIQLTENAVVVVGDGAVAVASQNDNQLEPFSFFPFSRFSWSN